MKTFLLIFVLVLFVACKLLNVRSKKSEKDFLDKYAGILDGFSLKRKFENIIRVNMLYGILSGFFLSGVILLAYLLLS